MVDFLTNGHPGLSDGNSKRGWLWSCAFRCLDANHLFSSHQQISYSRTGWGADTIPTSPLQV